MHPSRLLRLTLTAASLATALCAQAAPATAPAKPKLVLVLVVDGLPEEQVLRYRDQYAKDGGIRRLLEQGAAFDNGHQAHGITLTAVGHTAILTGAYPYQHGIIGNNWINPATLKSMYCTEDTTSTYIGEETKPADGTSPANMKVGTIGDELRYATGGRAKVITVSGKDRGAILLAGKTGTAYMYMDKTGNFASATYYMKAHPEWVTKYNAAKPQDRYYGKTWKPMLPEKAYLDDVQDGKAGQFKTYGSESGQLDAGYYGSLRTGPYMDELTVEFAVAAVDNENLGRNPSGATDLLGVSLSGHDYVNHSVGPESKLSHDHLLQLDRMIGKLFDALDKRVGADNYAVVFTADHGFPNVPEFAQKQGMDAGRVDSKKMMAALEQHLSSKFTAGKYISASLMPNIHLDYALAEKNGVKRAELEDAVARFLLAYPGIANVYTRSQFEAGLAAPTRNALLMQRAWNRAASGDVVATTKPYWYFGYGEGGTSHGSPYAYDTNVPLILMGKKWFKPGAYSGYAEVVDIVPTLAHVLQVRKPAGAEGRALVDILR